MKTEVASAEKNKDKNIKGLLYRKSAPKSIYVLLLILYLIGTYLAIKMARSSGVFEIMGNPTPIPSYTGIFASLANLCVILLTVWYGKVGFITSICALIIQYPNMVYAMVVHHNFMCIPGFFSNVLTLTAVIFLHINYVKIERYQATLRNQAVVDSLTGLPNRLASAGLISELTKKKEKFVVTMIDLNNFKNINDTKGHNTGNAVLSEIASRWKNAIDQGLSGTKDFISRQGGDEFALIIRDYHSDEDIRKTIQCYESELEKMIVINGQEFFITASFGYSEYPTDAKESNLLFSYADAAMYNIKRMGNSDHICRFTPELVESANHANIIERKIRVALDNDLIYFNLQPQYDMTHRLCGFEALARMRDVTGNVISPSEFVPVAEQVGLIDQVDGSVFRNSAMFFGELIRKTGTDITLSVNISVRHLMKPDFVDEVKEILETSGVPPKQLEIEITESIMIDSEDKALACMAELNELGIKIALDDFGTGYSSLSYLNKIPANLLKIDKSFIDEMNQNESSKQYVASIVSIGHIMNMNVIAEGVEEADQIETLYSIGCDMVQGFIWGRPLSADAAAELVEQSVAM